MRSFIPSCFWVVSAMAVSIAHCDAKLSTSSEKVYVDPETIPEHGWDRDLFRSEAQVPSMHLEFLYWQVYEGALSYAIKMNQSSWGPEKNGAIGIYENASYSTEPGFRVGLSFFRAPHYWEIFTQYTHLTSRGSDSIQAPKEPGQYLNATWQLPFEQGLEKATSSLHLNYHLFDIYFTRYFHPNPHLRMRLIGGISGTWLDQSMLIDYTAIDLSTDHVSNQWHYSGAGFRAGFMADWYWFTDLYLTSKISFAGFIGRYRNQNIQQTSTSSIPGYNPEIPFGCSLYRDTRGVTNTQFILGPSWQKSYTSCRVELFAGCEYNLWTNLQEVYRTNLTTPQASKAPFVNTGILSLIGLTTRLTVDF